MILPHPESDLSSNVMVLGVEVVKFLKKNNGYVFIDTVMNNFLKSGNCRTVDVFFNTLVFLYSLGVVDKSGYKIKLTPRITSNIQTEFL